MLWWILGKLAQIEAWGTLKTSIDLWGQWIIYYGHNQGVSPSEVTYCSSYFYFRFMYWKTRKNVLTINETLSYFLHFFSLFRLAISAVCLTTPVPLYLTSTMTKSPLTLIIYLSLKFPLWTDIYLNAWNHWHFIQIIFYSTAIHKRSNVETIVVEVLSM